MSRMTQVRTSLIRPALTFLKDRAGSILTIIGISAPVLVGITALAVDVGYWYLSHRVNQTAADAAAIAGAFARLHGKGTTVAAAAKADAERNGVSITGSTVMTVNNPPTSGAYSGEDEAVEVIITMPQQTLLSGVIYSGSITQKNRAVAMVKVQGNACILALSNTASSAVKVWGSTFVEARGCVIGSNSNASNSIDIGGSSSLTAESLWAVGEISGYPSDHVSLTRAPYSDMWALDDPYADLTIPSVSNCQSLGNVNSSVTLNPGTYCDFKFQSKAVVTLKPGTYYIDSGDVAVAGGATVKCSCPNATDGVTIVMTSSHNSYGTVTINGGANMTLNAPTDSNATYKGVLFAGDPKAPSGSTQKFNGGANMNLNGALHFPNSDIQFNGDNSASAVLCTQIIGNTIEFTGNSKVIDDGCKQAGIQPIEIKGVEIVE